MPRAPKGETYEQKKERYLQAGYKQAKTRKQNLNDDGTLKVTEDDLWFQAHRYMEGQMERESKREHVRIAIDERNSEDDVTYRESQERKYKQDYEWNSSNDLADLDHLLNLEIQIRAINRELGTPGLLAVEKEKLRKTLNEAIREHRQLQSHIGIDRPAREKKVTAGDPMVDWERIKEEALLKKQMQRQELLEKLPEIETEAELRDMLKYGTLENFGIIDPILTAHRRVLGIPEELQKA